MPLGKPSTNKKITTCQGNSDMVDTRTKWELMGVQIKFSSSMVVIHDKIVHKTFYKEGSPTEAPQTWTGSVHEYRDCPNQDARPWHKGMDDQTTLSQFQRSFLQVLCNQTTICHSRMWGGFPEIRSIFSINSTHPPWW